MSRGNQLQPYRVQVRLKKFPFESMPDIERLPFPKFWIVSFQLCPFAAVPLIVVVLP
jgi:hypothetical protein